jgi:hypothetical protein
MLQQETLPGISLSYSRLRFEAVSFNSPLHYIAEKFNSSLNYAAVSVPDPGSRIRDVVLVRCIFGLGKPQGVGILEWGGDEEGMKMGRSVYEQPGTKVDRILSHRGGFPSK